MASDDKTTRRLGGETPTRKLDVEATNGHRLRFEAGATLSDGRYRLEANIGHGGMAMVWLARDQRLDRPVAIKILADTLASDSEYLQRFEREATVAAQLAHPNLVPIYDFEGGERPYLVMEYVEGGDLSARIGDEDLDPGRIARDLLAALDHIHGAGVLHRDVKPQNVLVGADGRARLTDFGVAQPSDATALTRTGHVLGTAPYLAPEVLRGAPSSRRSDLYAIGMLIRRLLETRGPGPDPALIDLIDRLCANDPGERPESALAALDFLDGSPGPITPPAVVTPAPAALRTPPSGEAISRTPPRGPIAMIIAAGAIVATALIISAILGDYSDEPRDTGSADAGQAKRQPKTEDPEQEAQDREGQSASERSPSPSGPELNDQGYALIQQGRHDEAVAPLRAAVEELTPSADGLTYAYALYNLGWALRLSGRPEQAIPVLERRLEIPNQTGVVRKQLELARADAGLAGELGKKPKKPKDD